MNRPRSSNSLGKMIGNDQKGKANGTQETFVDPASGQVRETLVIELDDTLFNGLSWASSFDFINQNDKG